MTELCVKDVEVEIFIEKNIHVLREKIYKFKSVQTIEIDIVPPNGDKEDFEALFGTKSEEIKAARITKFKLNLASPVKIGIDVKSNYIDRLIKAVSKGFGKMVVRGNNQLGTGATLTSDNDAPFTIPIPDRDKDNLIEFPIRAKAGIAELIEHQVAIEVSAGSEK